MSITKVLLLIFVIFNYIYLIFLQECKYILKIYRFKFLIELISNPKTSIDQQYRANVMALMFSGVSIPQSAETSEKKCSVLYDGPKAHQNAKEPLSPPDDFVVVVV